MVRKNTPAYWAGIAARNTQRAIVSQVSDGLDNRASIRERMLSRCRTESPWGISVRTGYDYRLEQYVFEAATCRFSSLLGCWVNAFGHQVPEPAFQDTTGAWGRSSSGYEGRGVLWAA